MLMSELVVALWFVPVALFIVIPLSILPIYLIHRVIKKVVVRVKHVQKSVQDVQSTSRVSKLHPRHAN